MKNSKIIIICFLIFLIISLITNYAVLTTKEFEPDYRYFSNPIVTSIYIISVVLDILLFVFIIINMSTSYSDVIKQEKFSNLIHTIILALVLLVWFELIYASYWYYGFGNHQNGLIASNWGIIGSIIFLSFLVYRSDKKWSLKILIFSSMLVLHVLIFLILSPINLLRL